MEPLFNFMSGSPFLTFFIVYLVCTTITEALGYVVRITENGLQIIRARIELAQVERKTPSRRKKS